MKQVARALATRHCEDSARRCANFAGALATRKVAAPEAMASRAWRPPQSAALLRLFGNEVTIYTAFPRIPADR